MRIQEIESLHDVAEYLKNFEPKDRCAIAKAICWDNPDDWDEDCPEVVELNRDIWYMIAPLTAGVGEGPGMMNQDLNVVSDIEYGQYHFAGNTIRFFDDEEPSALSYSDDDIKAAAYAAFKVATADDKPYQLTPQDKAYGYFDDFLNHDHTGHDIIIVPNMCCFYDHDWDDDNKM